MDYLFYVLLLIIACIAMLVQFVIPLILTYLLYKWLKKKGYIVIGVGILTAMIVFELFCVYTAIYPLDSYYKEEFEDCFKTKFPKSGKIIAKDATYPSIHGDYSATFLAQLNTKDYDELLVKYRADTNYHCDTLFTVYGIGYDNILSKIPSNSSTITYIDGPYGELGGNAISFCKGNMILVEWRK